MAVVLPTTTPDPAPARNSSGTDGMPAPATRRGFLGTIAAFAVVPAAGLIAVQDASLPEAVMPVRFAPGPDSDAGADADLIEACHAFVERDAQWDSTEALAWPEDVSREEVRLWAADCQYCADLGATTLPGLLAKAEAALAALLRDVPAEIGSTIEDASEPHEWIAYRLAQDVVAVLSRQVAA